MTLLLFVDCETTGLDPTIHHAIEVAGVLWNVDHRCTVAQCSTVLPLNEFQQYGAGDVHSIPEDVAYGRVPQLQPALDWFRGMRSNYVVAHNADFDRAFFAKLGLLKDATWLDSMDLNHTHYKASPSLVELALHYGVTVVSAHRALDDCQLLARIFERLPDPMGAVQHMAMPREVVIAEVSYDGRQLAKDAGFHWDRLVPRKWTKRVIVGDRDFPFPVIPA